MSEKHGGSAFPRAGDVASMPVDGMSLRDYFATHLYYVTLDVAGNEDFDGAARDAYRRADAMLAEREK